MLVQIGKRQVIGRIFLTKNKGWGINSSKKSNENARYRRLDQHVRFPLFEWAEMVIPSIDGCAESSSDNDQKMSFLELTALAKQLFLIDDIMGPKNKPIANNSGILQQIAGQFC